MGHKTAYALIVCAFVAMIVLNPGQDRHRTAFMDYAHAHFFELPAGYRDIYEQLRDNSQRAKASDQLRYGNFLLFSTLSHTTQKRLPTGGFRPERRPLTIGTLGFVWPITLEPSVSERSAIEE